MPRNKTVPKYAPMGSYPTADEIPAEWWGRLNISREDFEKRRARRLAREKDAPAPGQPAPDFSAERLSATGERTGETFRLSSARGRHLALVFGSYT